MAAAQHRCQNQCVLGPHLATIQFGLGSQSLTGWTSFWKVSYNTVRRVMIDFPSEQPLFYQQGEGFGDWGYHELTDAESGFLRHEVLFASGAVLLFEFREVVVTSMARSGQQG